MASMMFGMSMMITITAMATMIVITMPPMACEFGASIVGISVFPTKNRSIILKTCAYETKQVVESSTKQGIVCCKSF